MLTRRKQCKMVFKRTPLLLKYWSEGQVNRYSHNLYPIQTIPGSFSLVTYIFCIYHIMGYHGAGREETGREGKRGKGVCRRGEEGQRETLNSWAQVISLLQPLMWLGLWASSTTSS